MKTKYIPVLGILFIAIFVTAAATLYFDLPTRFRRPATTTSAGRTYTCPMHAEVVQDHPGQCPKCGMALRAATGAAPASHANCEHEGAADTCCPKPAASPMRLPPGHPPVPMQLPAGHPPIDGLQTNQVSSAGLDPVEMSTR